MTGLSLGSFYQAKGLSVQILEKSHAYGGRMATRRTNFGTFDHGAQFIHMKPNSDFIWKKDWDEKGFLSLWFVDTSGGEYFVCHSGINQLSKEVPNPGEIIFKERITKVKKDKGEWILYTEANLEYRTKGLVFTAPLPQSLQILRDSEIDYPKHLDEIVYNKAIVALFSFEEELIPGRENKFQTNLSNNIRSLALQSSKLEASPIRYTMVMSPEFSELHFEKEEEEIRKALESEFAMVFSKNLPKEKLQIKKWRYSEPKKKADSPYSLISASPLLVLAGDAFGGGSILGAIRSAEAVYKDWPLD
ncbi:fumarate reductase/succinate dehydrogenase flavoprotein domain protein [Leptospira ryugenii]|uniref:Fumarate reductase/succinate dehydrogenase flavoprotein domain protein n=2 Tax=Leptospira ryugenii TaxID=1917863 RepID=A0A2P2DZ60_9LEPT|nr:fumarate reductase/succinate dehydrogenase flavoprotein domain protein [Leptospira ryugenii]